MSIDKSPLFPPCHTNKRPLLWIILLIALTARLYSVGAPLTDGGQERQTQVAMIARNLYRDNLNLLYPRMDTFAPGPGYTALEFPLQPALMAIVYHFVGIKDIVGRLIVIAFSMGSIVFMYLLCRFLFPEKKALITTAIYALTPMSIFFGRAVFPEALLLFFSLGALYFILRWSDRQKARDYLLSLMFAATAFLVKAPPGMVMVLPIGAVWWVRWRRDLFRRADFYIYFGLAILPIALWGFWSNHIGPPDPGWNPYQLAALRRWGIPDAWFSPAFYSWLVKSLVFVTLTPLVVLLAIAGLVEARNHPLGIVVLTWVGAMILFVIATPGAQMSHWNYQVPLIPVGAVLAGFGASRLSKNRHVETFWLGLKGNRILLLALGALIVMAHGVIYAAVIRDAYDVHKRVPYAVEVGRIVQREFPNEGFLLLIQPRIVLTTQSYFMDRKVRSLSDVVTISEVDQWRARGAIGVVAVDTSYGSGTEIVRGNPDLLSYLRKNFRTVAESDNYMIFSALKPTLEETREGVGE